MDAASPPPANHKDHSDSRPGTAAKICAAIALLSVLTAGCSSSGSGVLTQDLTSASTSSASGSQMSLPVSTSPSGPISSAPTSASTVSPTPVTQTSNPWPADLTPEQQDQAKAALAALDSYIQVTNAASADPAAKDWTTDVRKYTADPEATQFLESLASMSTARVRQVEPPTYEDPTVTAVDGNRVSIVACVDRSQQDVVDENGDHALQPAEVPRKLWTATVYEYEAQYGGWLVSETAPAKPVQPC